MIENEVLVVGIEPGADGQAAVRLDREIKLRNRAGWRAVSVATVPLAPALVVLLERDVDDVVVPDPPAAAPSDGTF